MIVTTNGRQFTYCSTSRGWTEKEVIKGEGLNRRFKVGVTKGKSKSLYGT